MYAGGYVSLSQALSLSCTADPVGLPSVLHVHAKVGRHAVSYEQAVTRIEPLTSRLSKAESSHARACAHRQANRKRSCSLPARALRPAQGSSDLDIERVIVKVVARVYGHTRSIASDYEQMLSAAA